MRGARGGSTVRILLATLAIAGAGWGAWTAFAPAGSEGLLVEADAATVAAGQPLYAKHCASCHGKALEGQPDWRQRKPDGRLPAPPHDDSGHTWHHPDELLIAITRHGMRPPIAPEGYQSDMPGFGSVLSDKEIRAVLAWIASQWSAQSREHQARVTRAQ